MALPCGTGVVTAVDGAGRVRVPSPREERPCGQDEHSDRVHRRIARYTLDDRAPGPAPRVRVRLPLLLGVPVPWLVHAVLVARGVPGDARLLRLSLVAVSTVAVVAVLVRAFLSRAGRERAGWGALAAGLSGYAAGFALPLLPASKGVVGLAGLNLADCLSLALFPLTAVAVALLIPPHPSRRLVGLVDAGIVLAAATSAGLAWTAVQRAALLEGDARRLVYVLGYPVGAFTVLVVTVACLAAGGERWSARWSAAVSGLALMTVGELGYAERASSTGFAFGTPLDLLYLAGPVLLGLAATLPDAPDAGRRDAGGLHWPTALLPTAAVLTAVAILVLDHTHDLPLLAVGCAAGAGVLAAFRMVVALQQEVSLERSRHEALTDPATGLGNRRAVVRHLARVLADGASSGVLLLVDVEGLADLHAGLGADVADAAARRLAKRLGAVHPRGNVGRLREAQFALVLPTELRPDDLAALCGALEHGIDVDGTQVALRACVGQAAPDGATTPEQWLRQADAAVRSARAAGVHVATHGPELVREAADRLTLLSDLRHALAGDAAVGGSLRVHYQGKHRAADGVLVAAEALVRWEHPTGGMLPPARFLQVAEDAGLMPALTDFVLRTALQDLPAFRAVRPGWQTAVNLGQHDLDAGLPVRLADALAAAGLPASALRLEVTEDVVMRDAERMLAVLHDVAGLGIGLSLDDYGTGRASLAHLRQLPVDELKIDRSFVARLQDGQVDTLLVASTVQLAHALGLRPVAEGAEDHATVRALAGLGCDLVQGYALSRPLPRDDLLLLAVPERAEGLPASR